MPSSDFWNAFAAISQAAAAVATFLTVWVATRQWSRQWKPCLSIICTNAILVDQGGANRDYAHVEITNVGIAPVVLSSLYYRSTPWATVKWFHPPDFTIRESTHLPHEMKHGGRANLFWRPADWDEAVGGALLEATRASRITRHFWPLLLRVEAVTTAGARFSQRPSKIMLARLRRYLAEAN